MKPQRDKNGNYPAYAWPGGYPIIYITREGEVLCAKCAAFGEESLQADIHWEGQSFFCDYCGTEIESAYGDPDEPE